MKRTFEIKMSVTVEDTEETGLSDQEIVDTIDRYTETLDYALQRKLSEGKFLSHLQLRALVRVEVKREIEFIFRPGDFKK